MVGAKGRTLVKIRQDAVVAIEDFLQKQVILFLWVKLRSDKKGGGREDEEDDLGDVDTVTDEASSQKSAVNVKPASTSKMQILNGNVPDTKAAPRKGKKVAPSAAPL